MWSILAVLLTTVPGVQCYDYNVGGLVASATFSVLLLIPIITMILVILYWRDWYMKRQAMRGRYRLPRTDWTTCAPKPKPSPTLASTPRSDRKTEFIRMYDIQPESRTSTIPRGMGNGVAEFSRGRKPGGYEEKVQSISFEPEEEAIIVADVLPDETVPASRVTLGHTLALTRRSEPYYTEPVASPTDMRATVVRLGHEGSEQNLRSTNKPEDYHVKVTYVDPRKEEEIFISPIIPSSNGSRTNDDVTQIRASTTTPATEGSNVAVMTFQDSDEEAGNIPNKQALGDTDVLF